MVDTICHTLKKYLSLHDLCGENNNLNIRIYQYKGGEETILCSPLYIISYYKKVNEYGLTIYHETDKKFQIFQQALFDNSSVIPDYIMIQLKCDRKVLPSCIITDDNCKYYFAVELVNNHDIFDINKNIMGGELPLLRYNINNIENPVSNITKYILKDPKYKDNIYHICNTIMKYLNIIKYAKDIKQYKKI